MHCEEGDVGADARESDDFYVVALSLRKMHSGH